MRAPYLYYYNMALFPRPFPRQKPCFTLVAKCKLIYGVCYYFCMANQELPATREVRRRIENIPDEQYRNALKFGWLGLCRVSEIVGDSYKSDIRTTPRGPTSDSFEVTEYSQNDEKIPVVIFDVKTAKRGGLSRSAAYPLDRKIEPWAVDLYDFFRQYSDENKPVIMFPFTRQKLWHVAREVFSGLTYPIEEYTRIIEEEELRSGMEIIQEKEDRLIVKHEKHIRSMATHAIRHIRAVDLMTFYGFSVQELSTIGGWTLRSMTGASGAISRYAHLDWRSYFPKLLIRRY